MKTTDPWRAFLAARVARGHVDDARNQQLAARVRAGVAAARDAWPALRLEEDAFAEHLAHLVNEAAIAEHDLPALALSDLYVATGCARGDARAIAALEEAFFGEVDDVGSRLALSKGERAELAQTIRERLFVGEAGPPKIATFVGRGPLRHWLRVSATHAALNMKRGRAAEPLDEQILAALADPQHDLELSYLKQHYRAEFKQAFARAVVLLSSRSRALLRYAFTERLTPARIGAIYGVHRTTAGRWIEEARVELGTLLRRTLKEHLRVGSTDLESIWRFVRSELDLSFERYLAPEVSGYPSAEEPAKRAQGDAS